MFGPIVAKPGTSRMNITGTWRMGMRPNFLRKNCTACKLCSMICPEGCITGEEKNTFTTDYNYCKGCGLCSEVCPKKDIIMEPEER